MILLPRDATLARYMP